MNANLGIIYQRARRYDEAAQQIGLTLSMDSNYMPDTGSRADQCGPRVV